MQTTSQKQSFSEEVRTSIFVGSVRKQLQNEIEDTLKHLNGQSKKKPKPIDSEEEEKKAVPEPDPVLDDNEMKTLDISIAKINVSNKKWRGKPID